VMSTKQWCCLHKGYERRPRKTDATHSVLIVTGSSILVYPLALKRAQRRQKSVTVHRVRRLLIQQRLLTSFVTAMNSWSDVAIS
jgi:hypothetical protein